MDSLRQLLAVARGEVPADLLIKGGRVVNVFTGEIEETDVAVFGGMIAGIGRDYQGNQTLDAGGFFVAPGLIDAHVHIESSLCVPAEFAAAVVPRGVTTVVTDPHEIANVAGPAGVRYMAAAARGLPLEVLVMAPSCVPATPMATAGGRISASDLAALASAGGVLGLAEVMNFPAVINGEPEMLAKLDALRGRPIDGHCPGVGGKALNAYIAAGIQSDHECTTPDEAREKLARGLYLLIREATNARNLDALLPVVTPENARRICFCTDDRTPGDLLREGSIDHMVRRAIRFGIAPIDALRMATLNTAERFSLVHCGAIAPGRAANVWLFKDLQEPVAQTVVSGGNIVAENQKLLHATGAKRAAPPDIGKRCASPADGYDLRVAAAGKTLRVIGAREDQLLTDHLTMPAKIIDGLAVADVERDVLKMAVINRHGTGDVHGGGSTEIGGERTSEGSGGGHVGGGSGGVGSGGDGGRNPSRQCGFAVGFIQGIGLRRGAIAGTVAHDHHNLVCIGADDESMRAACEAVLATGGGLAVADATAGQNGIAGDGGTAIPRGVLATLPLPVAGLMSDRPIAEVAHRYDRLLAAAAELGSRLHDPFMAMSFMALEVIPSLKLTDQGLVDVEKFERVGLFVDCDRDE